MFWSTVDLGQVSSRLLTMLRHKMPSAPPVPVQKPFIKYQPAAPNKVRVIPARKGFVVPPRERFVVPPRDQSEIKYPQLIPPRFPQGTEHPQVIPTCPAMEAMDIKHPEVTPADIKNFKNPAQNPYVIPADIKHPEVTPVDMSPEVTRADIKNPYVIPADMNPEVAPADITHPELIPVDMNHEVAVADIKHPELIAVDMNPEVAPADITHPELIAVDMNHEVVPADIKHPELIAVDMNHEVAPADIKHPELIPVDMNPEVAQVGIDNPCMVAADIKHPDVPKPRWTPTPPLISLSEAFFISMRSKKRRLDEPAMEEVLPGVSRAFQMGSNELEGEIDIQNQNVPVVDNEEKSPKESDSDDEMEDVTSLWLWNLVGL